MSARVASITMRMYSAEWQFVFTKCASCRWSPKQAKLKAVSFFYDAGNKFTCANQNSQRKKQERRRNNRPHMTNFKEKRKLGTFKIHSK